MLRIQSSFSSELVASFDEADLQLMSASGSMVAATCQSVGFGGLGSFACFHISCLGGSRIILLVSGGWCTQVRAVKNRLSSMLGLSRFRLKLCLFDRMLLEDDSLDLPATLQLVKCDYCSEATQLRDLFSACEVDDAKKVEALLQQPLDPNMLADGRSALQLASFGGALKSVKLLLEAGADRDASFGRHGITPLMNAADQGHAEVVRALVEAKADKDTELLLKAFYTLVCT